MSRSTFANSRTWKGEIRIERNSYWLWSTSKLDGFNFEWDIIFMFNIKIKHAHDRQEEWRDTINDLETMLSTETVFLLSKDFFFHVK